MINADLHTHTIISHGQASVKKMYASACDKNLQYIGFSEHSPLPPGFFCALYTGNLERDFPAYVAEIIEMKSRDLNGPIPLLGIELDWIPSQFTWMNNLINDYPFDFALGSLHYLDGYSTGNPKNWPENIPIEEAFARFQGYFYEMGAMVQSGLINIASHPDFIKLRAYNMFHEWLKLPAAVDSIAFALEKMKKYNVAMEINAAGLRWDFHEPYPCPMIMRLAHDLRVDITFGSDAHRPEDIAGNFEELKTYASSFGFSSSLVFIGGEPLEMRF